MERNNSLKLVSFGLNYQTENGIMLKELEAQFQEKE
jgi:hypothetical protein